VRVAAKPGARRVPARREVPRESVDAIVAFAELANREQLRQAFISTNTPGNNVILSGVEQTVVV
jgi:hypothetical protein